MQLGVWSFLKFDVAALRGKGRSGFVMFALDLNRMLSMSSITSESALFTVLPLHSSFIRVMMCTARHEHIPLFIYTVRMVDRRDPIVTEKESWAVEMLWHAVNGAYLWEFFTTLDYEWSIMQGHRPYRWTIWIYSLTRVAALMVVISSFVSLDLSTPHGCQALTTISFFFAFLAVGSASLLIVLRTIAIWNRNRLVVAISLIVWGTNVAFLIQGVAEVRSAWEPNEYSCIILNMHSGAHNFMVTLISDTILLFTMLVGLFRANQGIHGSFSLGRLLWKQGVVWLLLAAAVEIPPVIFIILNLNEYLDIMFQMPLLITLSIAATRLYRSLAEFVSGSTGIAQENERDLTTLKATWTPAVHRRSSQIDVTVHTIYEQRMASQMGHHSSHIGIDGQLSNNRLSHENESGMEN